MLRPPKHSFMSSQRTLPIRIRPFLVLVEIFVMVNVYNGIEKEKKE